MTLKIYSLKKKHSEIKPQYHGKEALKELANRNDLIITRADKGGATVTQDIDSYIEEATRQLEDKKLTINPTLEYDIKTNAVIDNFKKQTFITEKTANLVKLENSKTPTFYASPKIHKQENPGRPVFN